MAKTNESSWTWERAWSGFSTGVSTLADMLNPFSDTQEDSYAKAVAGAVKTADDFGEDPVGFVRDVGVAGVTALGGGAKGAVEDIIGSGGYVFPLLGLGAAFLLLRGRS